MSVSREAWEEFLVQVTSLARTTGLHGVIISGLHLAEPLPEEGGGSPLELFTAVSVNAAVPAGLYRVACMRVAERLVDIAKTEGGLSGRPMAEA
jgi:hypothetical protein